MNKYNKWTDLNSQLLQALRSVREARVVPSSLIREDHLDGMMYGLMFGTADETYRMQERAKQEAEREQRPYTPVFWTAPEPGADPVLTLWRIT